MSAIPNKYADGCCDLCIRGAESLEFYPEQCEGCDGVSRFEAKPEKLFALLGRDCWLVEKSRIIPCRVSGLSYQAGTSNVSADPRAGGYPHTVTAANIGSVLFFNLPKARETAKKNEERD